MFFAIFLLNDVDIQPILEFKHSFVKNHPVFPKNPLRAFYLGHPVYSRESGRFQCWPLNTPM